MTEKEYVNRSEVTEFVEWLIPKLKNYPVVIKYKKVHETFQFQSIEDAANKYQWPFSYTESATNKKITGTTYEHSIREFTKFRKSLKKGIDTNNDRLCSDTCKDILAWGGVLNKGKNREKANSITAQYLKEVIAFFSNKNLSLNDNLKPLCSNNELTMNAGFTKIYALLMDNFIIYDGRVGGALGKLVIGFLHSKIPKNTNIPDTLHFAWGLSQGTDTKRIDPSDSIYTFRKLSSGKLHTNNNIRANWLLKKVINDSKTKMDIWQLQSALFMLGYDVKQ